MNYVPSGDPILLNPLCPSLPSFFERSCLIWLYVGQQLCSFCILEGSDLGYQFATSPKHMELEPCTPLFRLLDQRRLLRIQISKHLVEEKMVRTK